MEREDLGPVLCVGEKGKGSDHAGKARRTTTNTNTKHDGQTRAGNTRAGESGQIDPINGGREAGGTPAVANRSTQRRITEFGAE